MANPGFSYFVVLPPFPRLVVIRIVPRIVIVPHNKLAVASLLPSPSPVEAAHAQSISVGMEVRVEGQGQSTLPAAHRWRILSQLHGHAHCDGQLVAFYAHRVLLLHSQPCCLPYSIQDGQPHKVRQFLLPKLGPFSS